MTVTRGEVREVNGGKGEGLSRDMYKESMDEAKAG